MSSFEVFNLGKLKEYKPADFSSMNVGDTVHLYDDGKINASRYYTGTVTEIIQFDAIDDTVLKVWRNEVKTLPHLYHNETDVFVKVKTSEHYTEYFVRTVDGGFFSFCLENCFTYSRMYLEPKHENL